MSIFKIKKEHTENLCKNRKELYHYLINNAVNGEIEISRNKIQDIADIFGYKYNTIKGSLYTLKRLKIIEIVKTTYSPFRRTKHLDFIPGSKEYRKSAYIKHSYDITMKDLEKLKEDQNSCCAICGKNEQKVGRLHIDHDHSTGKVRSLLCFSCNIGLGKFSEDINILKSAINYLDKWRQII